MPETAMGGGTSRDVTGDFSPVGGVVPAPRPALTFLPQSWDEGLSSSISAPTLAFTPSWSEPARVAVLVALDLAALVLAFSFAVGSYARLVLHQPITIYLHLSPLIILFPLSYALGGLYPGFGIGPVETLRQLSLRSSFVFVALATGTFVLKLPQAYSRVTFGIAWFCALLVVPLARFLTLRWLRSREWGSAPALVIGPRSAIVRLDGQLDGIRQSGYRAALTLATDRLALPLETAGWDHRSMVPRHLEQLAGSGIKVVLFVDDGTDHTNVWVPLIQGHFRNVILLRSHDPLPVEGVGIRDLGGVLGIEFRNQLLLLRNRVVKRLLDIILTTGGVLLAAPLVGVAALAVKIISPGPAFFGQSREGLNGEFFTVWKLRTMHLDAQARLTAHLEANLEARLEWERTFKLKKDPRIIPIVGHLLRRLSLDELPQLWNVLIGEMSLVGPRPFPKYHLERFDHPFLHIRRQVRPGLSGLWQVTCRSDGGLELQEKYDTYYIRNWSVWMDLYVLAKTAVVVLGSKGAY